ncbi:Wadjet anti-phage system protein JetA family protein [Bacillus pumilus]|uniref:Wadjet anti-phage system protein JetA family protein n=1 Tax=Bacillus pumilus TaxID=1408 RepID=UPI00119E9BBA|nr:Wadjet anti-phage system protein JetA family protein [Bacillus pumilus]
MSLFNKVSESFFSTFTSKHRILYLKALYVVLECFRNEIIVKKDELISMLCSALEEHFSNYDGDEEDLKESSISEKAHALIRKFRATGWIETEQLSNSLEEFFVIPDYAVKLLITLKEIDEDKPQEYNSLVSSTYYTLKGVDQERGEHAYDVLLQAHRMTIELKDNLLKLLNNMGRYHQAIHGLLNVQDVLEEHFGEYKQVVSERLYHPLKTFDSVDRFKVRIIKILNSWILDDSFIEIMSNRPRNPDKHIVKEDIIHQMNEILKIYEYILPQLLQEIDRKHNGYIKASIYRMQYLMNRDRDIKGVLIEVLKEMGNNSKIVENISFLNDFPFYQVEYVNEESLYKKPKKREIHDPDPLEDEELDNNTLDNELKDIKNRAKKAITRKKVEKRITEWLINSTYKESCDFDIKEVDDFLLLIMSVVISDESGLPYQIEFKDEYIYVNGYRIPELLFKKVGV